MDKFFAKPAAAALAALLLAAPAVPSRAAAPAVLCAAAAESGEALSEGDYDYAVTDGGTAVITFYRGTDEKAVIPDTLGGKKVTEIGYGAFAACASLKSVVIPPSVTKIGGSAFAVCDSLSSVTIPETVTQIDIDAFYLTPWLDENSDEFVIVGDGILLRYNGSNTAVDIPGTVRVIGCGAFSYFGELSSVSIPDSVQAIESMAFFCTKLTEVTVPHSVTRIGDQAFLRCSQLTSAFIPASVNDIGSEVFMGCGSLTIRCGKNTAAERYAQENSISYELVAGEEKEPAQPDPNIRPAVYGDVDADGQITAADALAVLRASIGLDLLNAAQQTAANVDGDADITANDALAVLRYSIGMTGSDSTGKPII